MITKKEMREKIFSNAIEEFSENYTFKMREKESFTIEDIKQAYKEGAIWMQSFADVWEFFTPKLLG